MHNKMTTYSSISPGYIKLDHDKALIKASKDAAKEVYEFVTQEFKHENIADGALVVVCDKGVP